MPAILLQPVLEERAYSVRFHVRVPARTTPEVLERERNRALELMIGRLATQGWHFVRLVDRPARGPLPVVPVKGFGKRPPRVRRKRGQASAPEPPDDSLWRISTLPTFGPKAPHLLTDEVEWEYAAIFHRPTIPTQYDQEPGAPLPSWLSTKR